jgi:hypothetical protein
MDRMTGLMHSCPVALGISLSACHRPPCRLRSTGSRSALVRAGADALFNCRTSADIVSTLFLRSPRRICWRYVLLVRGGCCCPSRVRRASTASRTSGDMRTGRSEPCFVWLCRCGSATGPIFPIRSRRLLWHSLFLTAVTAGRSGGGGGAREEEISLPGRQVNRLQRL